MNLKRTIKNERGQTMTAHDAARRHAIDVAGVGGRRRARDGENGDEGFAGARCHCKQDAVLTLGDDGFQVGRTPRGAVGAQGPE